MDHGYTEYIEKSDRIPRLISHLFEKMPAIEADRAVLITQSYRETETEPVIMRRAKAFEHILKYIPIVIRPAQPLLREGVKYFPSFLSSGWRVSSIPLPREMRIPSLFRRTPRGRCTRYFSIGRVRPPVSWPLPTWHRRL